MKRTKIQWLTVVLPLLLITAALILAVPARSYIPVLTPSVVGTPQAYRWSMASFPLQWNLNPTVGSNITGSQTVQTVMQNSFNSWVQAPNTAITIAQGANSLTNQEQSSAADINLICFVCNDVSFGGSEVLAVTIPTAALSSGIDDNHGGLTQFAGQLVKADIVFNPAVPYSTDGTSGTVQDLQTVATHEIGHFFGLDHSAVTRAAMFPFAPDSLTTLSFDDAA